MSARAVQRFEVSLKAFIVRPDGHALLVREADTGYWELPGGRIDVGEEWQAHDAVVAREIAEELGPDLEVELTPAAVTWTRRRPIDGVFQFICARPARWRSGVPRLSAEHDRLDWFDAAGAAALMTPPESGYPAALARLFVLVAGR
jgi:8-oxo-dGTP pyrophosphatase MutT (NUDIX family)